MYRLDSRAMCAPDRVNTRHTNKGGDFIMHKASQPLNPLSPRMESAPPESPRASDSFLANPLAKVDSVICNAALEDEIKQRIMATASSGARRVTCCNYKHSIVAMADIHAQRTPDPETLRIMMANHERAMLPPAGQRTPRMTRERDLISLNSLITGMVE